MMVARNGSFAEKKDLHVGGLGNVGGFGKNLQPRLAAAAATPIDAMGKSANHVLRGNPWVALGLGAALGLTAGYLLSRRS
jgi:hypothetical protein